MSKADIHADYAGFYHIQVGDRPQDLPFYLYDFDLGQADTVGGDRLLPPRRDDELIDLHAEYIRATCSGTLPPDRNHKACYTSL